MFVPGVMIEFSQLSPKYGYTINRIIGNPRFEGDKVLGTEIGPLLSELEKQTISDVAVSIRQMVETRDIKRANERAAAEISTAHYREKARQQANLYNVPQENPGVVYTTPYVDPNSKNMGWLQEPGINPLNAPMKKAN